MGKLNKQLDKLGYITADFSQELKVKMAEEILSRFLGYKVDSFEELELGLSKLDEATFSKIIPKSNRSFSTKVSDQVLHWVETNLNELFGERRRSISACSEQEVAPAAQLKLGDRSVYWRSVRKNKDADVGHAHRDSTFWEIETAAGYDPICPFKYRERWKVWIPVFGCDPLNSIQLVEGSHKESIPTNIMETEKGTKPFIADTWLVENNARFESYINDFNSECIIFHDDLVHKGPVNQTTKLRVSVEFTILVE